MPGRNRARESNMNRYRIVEGGTLVEHTFMADDRSDAIAQARDWLTDCELGDRSRTLWVDGHLYTMDDEDEHGESVIFRVDPEAPACPGRESHDLKQTDVWGDVVTEQCRHCGATLTTYLRATRKCDGRTVREEGWS